MILTSWYDHDLFKKWSSVTRKKMSFFFFTYLIYTGNQRYKCTKNYYKNMLNK